MLTKLNYFKHKESNTEHLWQDYVNNMLCQVTWADALIIQSVANCLNLSIHIAESFETFAPVTVQAMNVTGKYTNIYIGHKWSSSCFYRRKEERVIKV